jgi:dTDP-glucose pyrophosphorylase
VPAAGRGTRLRSVTDRAKELVAVGGKPLLAHALEQLAASGISEALVVTSPHKPELRATFGDRHAGVALHWAVQDEPRGLADALSLAEPFAAGEPFLCWLPDNVWAGERPAAAQVVAASRLAPGADLVGLIEAPLLELTRFGAAGFVKTTPHASARDASPDSVRLVEIVRVLDKGSRPRADASAGATVLKGFPFHLWQPSFFDRARALRAAASGRGGELDDTPLLQQAARERRLAAVVLRGGRLFDCGIPDGLAAARAALGG